MGIIDGVIAGGGGGTSFSSSDITGQAEEVVTPSDEFVWADVSDSDNLKKDTVQGVLDLVAPDLAGKADTVILAADKITFYDATDSDNPKTDTVQGILDLSPAVITESFTSSEQTITSAGQLVLAHSLSSIPVIVQYRIINKTAEGNYSIGDEVIVDMVNSSNGTDNYSNATVDSTNITIRLSSNSAVFPVTNKTTGAIFGITAANWKLVVRAFA